MRVVVALFLLALLGLGIWSLSSSSTPPAVSPGNGAPSEAAPNASRATSGTPTPADTQRDVAPDRTVQATYWLLPIRTIDAATGKPLPNTEVLWTDGPVRVEGLTAEQRDLYKTDVEQYYRSHGNRVVTDTNGRVVVRAKKLITPFARNGSSFAKGRWSKSTDLPATGPYAGELVLLLQPDQTLHVRTVHASGQPAPNVMVRLVETVKRKNGGTWRIPRDQGRTNSAGVLIVRHTQTLLRERVVGREIQGVIPCDETELVVVDFKQPPAEPVSLLVPDLGTVAVQLRGKDSRPWLLPRDNNVMCTLKPSGWTDGAVLTDIDYKKFDVNGSVSFQVPCGTQLAARTSGLWSASQDFAGPKHAGERVDITFQMPKTARLVTGRVLAEDSSPFEGGVAIEFVTNGQRSRRSVSRFDDGRFHVLLSTRVGELPEVFVNGTPPGQGSPLGARVRVNAPLVIGDNDLGDIVLREAPILVAGHFVLPGDADTAVKLKDVDIVVERLGPNGKRWSQANGLPVAVDDAHQFEVRTLRSDGSFRLRVRGACTPMQRISFEKGDTDLRIELTRGSSVSATFLVDDLWPKFKVRLAADNPVEQDRHIREYFEEGQSSRDGDHARVDWQHRAAGKYHLLVSPTDEAPIIDIPLELPAAGTFTEPRLQDIDLRGRLHEIAIKVTNAEGQLLTDQCAVVRCGPLTGGVTWNGTKQTKAADNGVKFALTTESDFFVYADGYRGAHLAAVSKDTTIALQPAPTVRIQWMQKTPLPDGVSARLRWQPSAWPTDGPHLLVYDGAGGALGASAASTLVRANLPELLDDGRATAKMESCVPMELHFYLFKADHLPQKLAAPILVDPKHTQDGQLIELHTDSAVVEQALRALAN
jgi:hypothetical protein